MTLAALGVVYGDIGTSPLYAMRECFAEGHGIAVDAANVVGVLSMITWTLVLIVAVKYVAIVLRADNWGEGGILALLALAVGDTPSASRRRKILTALGVLGAALLYGDGVITPCITVMGAVEGLQIAAPGLNPPLVPISIAVLLVLFAFQRAGTGRVGRVLGPIMLVWFAVLAALGVRGIAMAPQVAQALLPWNALWFAAAHGTGALVVVGAVFLVVTGAEALYADLGHFGAGPIRRAWFAIVFPALLLNYFGQGGLLLANPAAVANPFFHLAPSQLRYALVVLAGLASVIASQALISGVFSLTMQAIQLGYLPRLEIRHTSATERGQIYMPNVNWLLMLACLATCAAFGSSGALASAYGVAVTMTMLITTVLLSFAAQRSFGWSPRRSALACALFAAMELLFLGANAVKILHGGWFPLVAAAAVVWLMATWRAGRRILLERYHSRMMSLDSFLDSLGRQPPLRVPGTAVYMSASANGVPIALLHNLKHNKVLHKQVLLLTIVVAEEPHVRNEHRLDHERLPHGLHRLVAHYGFMEQPRVLEVLKRCQDHDIEVRISDTTFFLGRESIVPATRRRMNRWRSALFSFLARNAQPPTIYFGLPANRVVEFGAQVEL